MRMRIIIPLVVIAVSAAAWFHGRSSARELQARLDSLQAQRRELLALEAERRRLLGSLDEFKTAAAQRQHSIAIPAAANPVPVATPFTIGEWTPSAAWTNRGQATPRDSLSTALWAAAGGDVMAMQLLLEIDPAARSKAEKLLNRLPPATRSSYVTPEALIAHVTAKIIPLTQAQIAWYHESDPDHAAIGVLFGTSESPPETVAKLPAGKQDNSPPSLSNNRTGGMALLAMRRTSSGWRLVVPVAAVDRIAREIGAAKP